MKARWLLDRPLTLIQDEETLANQLARCAMEDSKALPLSELLANVQHHGGWRGNVLHRCGIMMIFELVSEPQLLRAVHDCDSSIFEGENAAILWTAAMGCFSLSLGAMESLLQGYDRPKELGAAPFDWFLIHHSGWPPELLARHGVNLECEAPPRPEFIEKLLSYEIPAAEREAFMRACTPIRCRGSCEYLLEKAMPLLETLPAKSILAAIAQEVMSGRLNLDKALVHASAKLQPTKFSRAAKARFREQVIIDLLVDFWSETFQNAKSHYLSITWMEKIEKCIREEFPEIREDVRFFWALDRNIFEYDPDADLPLDFRRSFERLRGATIQERPVVPRVRLTGMVE